MPDVGAALRGRTFGLPNGVLLLAVAAGIYWFFIRGKTAGAAGTPNAAAAGSQLQSGYGLGFAQGQQAAQAGQPPASTPAASPAAATQQKIGAGYGLPTLPNVVSSQGHSYAQTDQPYPSLLAAGQGDKVYFQAAPGVFLPVTQQVAATGAASGAPLFIQQIAGLGGGAPVRKHHIGSRSSNSWHDAHPLIGAPVKYAHYVRVGGPRTAAAHHANINHVAQQAGVHPARVSMLNPVPTGLIRIA